MVNDLTREGGGAPYGASLGDLLKEAGVLVLAAGLMALFSQNAPLMRALLALLAAARFFVLYRRGDIVVFLLGMALGGGNDLRFGHLSKR